MSGKGDRYRPVDREKWSSNYDQIFKKKAQKEAQKRNKAQVLSP